MANKQKVLNQLDQFRHTLEEYLTEPQEAHEEVTEEQVSAKEFIEISDQEEVGDDARCMVCQKAINQLEGAYLVGDEYWVCSSFCEENIDIRPTVKFRYR